MHPRAVHGHTEDHPGPVVRVAGRVEYVVLIGGAIIGTIAFLGWRALGAAQAWRDSYRVERAVLALGFPIPPDPDRS